jgi:predicted NBD/HSP70 family sugar kinase
VVDNLLAKGFAFSRRETPSGRGRPSIPLCVNSGAGYFAGIDIGASQTKTVFCDLAFNIVHRRYDATLEYDGSGSFLNWLSELFESALSESRVERDKLLGLGLAVSGNVDSETA